MYFDLIGDIHGQSEKLEELLQEMGYQLVNGCYQHIDRIVIYLGDFIDRGANQRKVIDIVRPMIEAKKAKAVLGNHELNAIAYHTACPVNAGEFMRPHTSKNFNQHEAFLQDYPDELERLDVINWFKTLPLWLDEGEFRVVHACWEYKAIDRV